MTGDAGPSVPGYNERYPTRASIVGRWMLLVPGCAVPLLASIWEPLSAPQLAGVAGGIATWTALMIGLHVWRFADGEYGATARLTTCAVAFMVMQWLLGVFAPWEAQFAFYSPAVIFASPLTRMELADPLVTYVLTLACGGQALVCILALSWAAARLRYDRNRPRQERSHGR
jgi:hypothetical protein